LFNACEDGREARAIRIGCCAGLRNAELCGLQLRHFKRPGAIWVSADIAKGARQRWIPVLAELELQVEALEALVEEWNAELPALREFVLPGGGVAAAHCHMARSICRRAERRCWALSRDEPVGPQALRYLNRLSDLLFVLARVLARRANGTEVMWRRDRGR